MLQLQKLPKGGNLQLSKATADFLLSLGVSWDKNTDSTMSDVDIDVFGIIVDSNGKGVDTSLVRFYNNVDGSGMSSDDAYPSGMTRDEIFAKAKKLAETSVIVITKDERTGDADGDDETLFVNTKMLMEGKEVIIAMNIYQAKERKQLFGMVKNPTARVYDTAGKPLLEVDCAEDFALETGIILGKFYLHNGEAKFKSLVEGFTGNMNDLIEKYK